MTAGVDGSIKFSPPTCLNQICAVMVTYFPAEDVHANAGVILEQVGCLIIVDNGTNDTAFLGSAPFCEAKCSIIRWDVNKGIAAALNAGIRKASELGYEWVLTMDQDTRLSPGCVEEMVSTWQKHKSQHHIGIMGPNYAGPNRLQKAIHGVQAQTKDLAIVREVITSGSLMPISLMYHVGEFREDFFIDLVDIDYCWRVRQSDLEIAIAKNAWMKHQLGETLSMPFIGGISAHSPLRTYYRFRNSVFVLKNAWTADMQFFVLRLVKMHTIAIKIFIFGRPWKKQITSLILGLRDGLAGISGERKS